MKIAPLIEEMDETSQIAPVLVHIGKHYNEKMSSFLEDLDISKPDIKLEIDLGSHAIQTCSAHFFKFYRFVKFRYAL